MNGLIRPFSHLTQGPARQWPGRLALADASLGLTFAELERGVESLALQLRRAGVKRGDRIAVLVRKDVQSVVAVLGALRSGAAYVPIDCSAPAERIKFLIADVEPALVIAPRSSCAGLLASWGLRSLPLEDVLQQPMPEETHSLSAAEPEDLAYVMYTSGSTGRPKGVEITHGNLTALVNAHRAVAQADNTSTFLNTTPLYFDGSIGDVLLPLSVGAAVQLGPALPVISVLVNLLYSRDITHLCIVPTVLRMMTEFGVTLQSERLAKLQTIIFGGESCSPQVVAAWLAACPNVRMVNCYGPTEATYVCISHEVRRSETSTVRGAYPIGRPHAGTHAMLIDETGAQIATAGRIGELVLGGAQLGRGYWRRPDEQRRAFFDTDGQRFYRTGDLCVLDDNGELVFVGRADAEAKVNGYRVNMNEIGFALRRCAQVENAVAFPVTARTGEAAIACALSGPAALSAADLPPRIRHELAKMLPGYMLPKFFLIVREFPMLATGKEDVNLLKARLQAALLGHDHDCFHFDSDAHTPALA